MSHPHPELGPPPALPENGLRIVALGGLGEVGRNMTVFEFGGRLLVVDCGVLFPDPDQPGIDLILPDFDYIRDRLDVIEAVVLTHGHEDHIGAVPYLLRERPDIPLIGSTLTGESCGKSATISPDDLPQPTRVDSRGGAASLVEDQIPLPGTPLGPGHREAYATTDPTAPAVSDIVQTITGLVDTSVAMRMTERICSTVPGLKTT